LKGDAQEADAHRVGTVQQAISAYTTYSRGKAENTTPFDEPGKMDPSGKPVVQRSASFQRTERSKQTKFPSFFTAESQFTAPYVLSNEVEAANLIHSASLLALNSGILIAVPIPKV